MQALAPAVLGDSWAIHGFSIGAAVKLCYGRNADVQFMTTVTRDDEGSPSGMLTTNRVPSGVTSYTTFLARSRAVSEPVWRDPLK
jgi:hypothetical protein